MRYFRIPLSLIVIACCIQSAAAQILETKKVGDKTISCMHTGLWSSLRDCGGKTDWYAYVFVGSISTIAPAANNEFEVKIIPEEVFYGTPGPSLTVFTSEGLCFPKLSVGDHWLFYFRKLDGTPIVLDYYGNDSRPVADAQEQINTLRKLKQIGNRAILRGEVHRGENGEFNAVPNAKVHARRKSDSKDFTAITDANGHYEFQPLQPDSYKIHVDLIGDFQADDDDIDLNRGACWDLSLTHESHSAISGYVRRPDGSPLQNVDVVLIASDNTGYTTTQTNQNGQYFFDLQPGLYFVGLNYPKRTDWFDGSGSGANLNLPPASWFYPGVANRADARIIQVFKDEKQDGINFNITMK